MNLNLFIFGMALTLMSNVLTAQDNSLIFKNYDEEHGMSNANIHSVIQDKYGFIWAGSYNGLIKFNGIEFTNYFHELNDANSVRGNVIIDICEDKKNNLWIATNMGLCFYDIEKDQFKNIILQNTSDSVIKDIFIDKHNNIWAINNTEVFLFNKHDSILYKTDDKRKILLDLTGLCSIMVDQNENIWLGTEVLGLFKINFETGMINNYFKNEMLPNNIELSRIDIIFEDLKGNIYVGFNGLRMLTLNSTRFKTYKFNIENNSGLGFNKISNIYEDRNNTIWLSGKNGIDKFDIKKETFEHYISDNKNANSIASNNVYALLEDQQGNLWCGTNSGLSVAQLHNKKGFKNLEQSTNKKPGLVNNAVTSFTEDNDGNIWIGTYDGLSCYNEQKRQFTNYKNTDKNQAILPTNSIQTVFADSKGRIWIGGYGGGLGFLYKNKLTLFNYNKNNKNGISHDDIRSIIEDKKGNIWIATNGGGLNKFIENNKTFEHYVHNEKTNSLVSNYCLKLYIDDFGLLYIGTYNGLSIFDIEKKTFENFDKELSNRWVYSLYRDKNDTLWIGTAEGLNQLNLITKKITLYAKADGLPDNAITGICSDTYNNLWLSTNKGISKLSLSTFKFQNYDELDGIKSNSNMQGAYYITNHGDIYFGTPKGVTIVKPKSIKQNTFIPPVIITDLLIKYKSNKNRLLKISNTDSSNRHSIEFNYKETPITFKYIALNYVNSKKNKYAYKLDGYDDWNYVDSRKEATYMNVPAGSYSFKVKACNDEGIWNEKGTSIPIKIIPPFWQELWFKLMLAMCILFIIYIAYLIKLKSLRNQRKTLKIEVEKRTTELSESNMQLTEMNQEILLQKEELLTQSEILAQTNQKLEKSTHELEQHKNNLEHLVKDRTFELEKAKEKAEESDKLKSAFLANMNHEIRTPMNAIIGFSNLLKNRTVTPIIQSNYIDQITSNTKSLLKLINDIIDISIIEANQIILHNEEFKLNALIEEVYMEGLLYCNGKDVRYFNKIENENYSIITDRYRLKQAIGNLLNNACKFTDEGYIELVLDKTDNDFTINIKDTGIGISKENFDLIFNQFTKINESKTKLFRGAGLGLSIAKKIIKLIGGELNIESQLGIGSLFKITLPLGKITDTEIKQKTTKPSKNHNWKEKHILLVEDEETNFQYIESVLTLSKVKITWAKNGFDALELFKNNQTFDLVLMDIKMPIMNGFDATIAIREINTEQIIIAQTAYSRPEDIVQIKKAGFNAYLIKPIEIDFLFDTLARFLNG